MSYLDVFFKLLYNKREKIQFTLYIQIYLLFCCKYQNCMFLVCLFLILCFDLCMRNYLICFWLIKKETTDFFNIENGLHKITEIYPVLRLLHNWCWAYYYYLCEITTYLQVFQQFRIFKECKKKLLRTKEQMLKTCKF